MTNINAKWDGLEKQITDQILKKIGVKDAGPSPLGGRIYSALDERVIYRDFRHDILQMELGAKIALEAAANLLGELVKAFEIQHGIGHVMDFRCETCAFIRSISEPQEPSESVLLPEKGE